MPPFKARQYPPTARRRSRQAAGSQSTAIDRRARPNRRERPQGRRTGFGLLRARRADPVDEQIPVPPPRPLQRVERAGHLQPGAATGRAGLASAPPLSKSPAPHPPAVWRLDEREGGTAPASDAGALEGRTGPAGAGRRGRGRAMRRYSIFQLARNALTRHENWWGGLAAAREPQPAYDASRHRRRRRPRPGDRLLKPWRRNTAGPGSRCSRRAGWAAATTGRNTTIIRSNYLFDASAGLYEACAEALGGPVAGAELQHHVQPARA